MFDPGKFDEIEIQSYEVKTIGDLDLNENESKILQLHPKFSVLGKLESGDLKFEQETSYAKLRIQLSKGEEERIDEIDDEDIEMTAEEAIKIEEVSATT